MFEAVHFRSNCGARYDGHFPIQQLPCAPGFEKSLYVFQLSDVFDINRTRNEYHGVALRAMRSRCRFR